MKKAVNRKLYAPCGSIVAMALATAMPAHAQGVADENEGSVGADEDTFLSDSGTYSGIIVTANRRAERNVDVPVAVSTLSGEKLDVLNSSGQDIRFLAGRTPSLQAESSFGRTFPRFYIRGLGNTDFAADAAQPVSVVYDDIALESPYLKAFPIFDLENVEVLKGPQGTLFGRNTPAGVIRLASARPSDVPLARASLSVGTYYSVNSNLVFSGPITDKIKYRLSGQYQRRDDWVKNQFDGGLQRNFEGYDDVAGRAQLEYDDGPFNALFNLHGRSLRGTARLFRANIFEPGTNDFRDGFDVEEAAQNGKNPQNLDTWGTNARLSYEFEGLGTLYSVTGYEHGKLFSRGDIDGGFGPYSVAPGSPLTQTPNAVVSAPDPLTGNVTVSGPFGSIPFPVETGGKTEVEEFTQEIRFASEKFGDVSFQAGAYYFDQNLDGGLAGSGEWDLNGDFINPADGSHLDNKTYALFGSVEYTPSPDWILRGGLRWSHDEKDSILFNGPTYDGSSDLLSEGHTSGSEWSWDGSAVYKLSPDMSVYGRIARGYLGAAIKNDNTAGVSTIAKPQTTTSYEIGLKGEQPGLFSYAFDVYYNNTKDIQLTAVGGSSNVTRLLNANKAVGYGVEAELAASPFENFDITAGGSYNYTELKDKGLRVPPCNGGCTVTDPIVGGFASIDGNRLPQAPRWIGNITARYGMPVGNGNELYIFTDWSYRSKVNFFLYESVEFTGKEKLEGGLRIGYIDNDAGFEIAAFARNITNKIVATGAIDFNNLTGFVNEPRIIGGEIKVGF